MRALLLAGGMGSRLKPITDNIQKTLLPIGGKVLIEYWLENLLKAGVDSFLINSHYKASQMREYVDNSPYKEYIELVYEEELLLTAGTILKNRDFFGNDSFMVVHADNLSFCDFKSFIDAHKARPIGCEITMMLFYSDDPSSCGIVELDSNDIVQRFYEKVANPPSNLANGAVYICERSVIDFIASLNKPKVDFSTEILPNFMGRIYTFLNTVYHRDIGTISSYQKALDDIISIKLTK